MCKPDTFEKLASDMISQLGELGKQNVKPSKKMAGFEQIQQRAATRLNLIRDRRPPV